MKKLACIAAAAFAVVLAGAPSAAGGSDTACDSGPNGEVPFTGVADNLVVRTGAVCVLVGAHVLGNVLAEPGSGLSVETGTLIEGSVEVKSGASTGAFQAIIRGSYKCDDCVFEDVIETTVGGNVEVKSADEGDFVLGSTIGGNLEILESTVGTFALAILGNTIGGSVKIEKNTGAIGVEGNTIAGNLQIAENTIAESFCGPDMCPPFGNGHIDGNDVGGNLQVVKNRGLATSISLNEVVSNLQCEGNEPAPVGGGNTAAKKQGQCRNL